MWINAMSRVAKRNGLKIPELLKQQRKKSQNLNRLPKKFEVTPKKKDPFEGLSTRELYLVRPMV